MAPTHTHTLVHVNVNLHTNVPAPTHVELAPEVRDVAQWKSLESGALGLIFDHTYTHTETNTHKKTLKIISKKKAVTDKVGIIKIKHLIVQRTL